MQASPSSASCTGCSSSPLELRLLNGFRLCRDRQEESLPLGTQRLLAFMAIKGSPMTRPCISGSLWLDASEARASANLRTALWRLRRLEWPVIVATRSHLRLNDAISVDYWEALDAARRVLGPDGPRGDELGLIMGELLPDWYDEWVVHERERLRLLRLHALEQLCRWLTAQGRLGEAIDAGMSAVGAEPMRESAHRALVEVHLAAGNWRAALHQYEYYSQLLNEELGLPPSEEMEKLIAHLRLAKLVRSQT
jgi:DNA-binding SARP family transcriptional activator